MNQPGKKLNLKPLPLVTMNKFICTILILILFQTNLPVHGQLIRVGSKHFNEGYLLSEMIAQILEDGGYTVERKFNLGGTAVSFEALRNNAIDVYPEYTGTISTEILKSDEKITVDSIRILLKKFSLSISEPYGFNNTYAILLSESKANQLGIKTISDLRNHPMLRLGLSYEFLERQDGWGNLSSHYNLPHKPVGLEHGLAYQAILENRIDVTDAYSTDGEIIKYDLILLKDDQTFFPEYQAVTFYHEDFPVKAKLLLDKLTNSISEAEMQSLNAKAIFEKLNHSEIAHAFLIAKNLINDQSRDEPSTMAQILNKTWVHIQLTLLGLIGALIVAIPTGILVYQSPVVSRTILYLTGILQTIPSIALLALLIPFVGIGIVPAVIALFIYALLPILRNTVIGLLTIDPQLKRVATAMGLNRWSKLRWLEIPLAIPSIITGIRIAAVINVGTATLAAFIGAGGLGEFIVTGLALNNTTLILMGAIPAALLAIVIELLFEGIEYLLVPNHLRQKIVK